MDRLRLLVAFSVLVVLLMAFYGRDDGGRRPDPRLRDLPPEPGTEVDATPRAPLPAPAAEGQAARSLPGASGFDPIYTVEPDQPCTGACTGTAFAVDGAGHWLTARHVVAGCATIALEAGGGRRLRMAETVRHRRADVSLLGGAAGAPPLAFAEGRLERRQDGFHLGYPAGRPGAVHGALIGRAKVRTRGRQNEAPALAWAEVSRNPDRTGSLGGLSGSPVLDAAGRVIGVTIAESPRRGRVISAAPVSLVEVLEAAGVQPALAAGQKTVLDDRSYGAHADRLRERRSVARVLCLG